MAIISSVIKMQHPKAVLNHVLSCPLDVCGCLKDWGLGVVPALLNTNSEPVELGANGAGESWEIVE